MRLFSNAKRSGLFLGVILGLILCGSAVSLTHAHASALAAAQSSAAVKPASHGSHMEEPETNNQIEGFRHAPVVQAIARYAHVSTETAAEIFEDFNSGVLIAVILYFVLKALPKAIRSRRATLEQQLIEARTAAASASERLAAVEERISKLGIEIEVFRTQIESEMAADEKRMRETIESERQRIVASAEQEIDAAGLAAQRELRGFAAKLTVERAKSELRLTPEMDRLLVESFGDGLTGRRN